MLEMMNRALMCHADRKTLKDEAWAFECLCESAEMLGCLARDHAHVAIRYEDLIVSAGARLMSKQWRQGVFPSLAQFDLVSFLFSLEYVERPLSLVEGLLRKGKRVIITYHCADDLPVETRQQLGFQSHHSRADWVRFAFQMNAKLIHDWAFDGFQSLICLE